MTVGTHESSGQHHAGISADAGRGVLEVPLGWTSGAVVSDHDVISKIRARQTTRNEAAVTMVPMPMDGADFRTM